MSHLLSRYAEAAFWMGRYMERAESLARIVDVIDTFSRSSRGIANWDALLALYADQQRFADRHGSVTGPKVVQYYLFDRGNPGSVIASIQFARENARSLRPMISSEIWEQLNTFNNAIGAAAGRSVETPGLYRLCRFIKEGCQTHLGVIDATMHRDEAWYFNALGRHLERGAQTAHYLDVRYQDLNTGDEDIEAADVTPWMALLRSQGALHGYRRSHPERITPRQVAGFLLLNRRFPRSLTTCVNVMERLLGDLRREFGLAGGSGTAERLQTLSAHAAGQTLADVLDEGLHEYLDRVQRALYGLSDELSKEFFVRNT